MVYEKGLIRVDRGQLIDKGNYAFDPAHPDFAGGADPDGLKDASRAFVDCDTEAFQRGAGVRPSIGVYRIARNITLKSGWDLPEGVVIRPDSGVTVTFDGRVRGMGDRDAQLDTSAGGSFTTNGPEWFYGDQGFLGTIIDRGGAQHDARSYGAVLDGTTDDRTALADAITAAQASGVKVVIVAGGTALVESNLTVPEGVTLRVLEGAKLKPANGVTLTINGTFDAGLYSVFDLSEGGSVVLGTGAVASVLPHWWGAVGDGVADDRAALSAADATGRAVMLPAGTYRVGSSLTLASAWQVRSGGLFRPANGVTVTINGAFEAGPYQVFDISAGGSVVFGAGAVERALPQWWGAKGDEVTDDTEAIQAAVNAVSNSGGVVFLPPGDYRIGTTGGLSIPPGVVLRGAGKKNVRIVQRWWPSRNFDGLITASGTYTDTDATTLRADASPGDTTLSVVDASAITVGEWYVLGSDAAYVNAAPSSSRDEDRYRGEMVYIVARDTDANTVTVRGWVRDSYATADGASLRPITFCDGVEISDLAIVNPEPGQHVGDAIKLTACRKFRIVGVEIDGFDGCGVHLDHCREGVIDACIIQNLTDDTANHRYGYGVLFNRATETVVVSNTVFRKCRHGTTTNGVNFTRGVPRDILVIGCESVECTNAAFDTHVQGHAISFISCHAARTESAAFQLRSPGTVVQACTASFCSYGVIVGPEADGCVIRGNTFRKLVRAADFGGYGVQVSGREVVVEDNTIEAPERFAIFLYANAERARIIRNTLINPGRFGVYTSDFIGINSAATAGGHTILDNVAVLSQVGTDEPFSRGSVNVFLRNNSESATGLFVAYNKLVGFSTVANDVASESNTYRHNYRVDSTTVSETFPNGATFGAGGPVRIEHSEVVVEGAGSWVPDFDQQDDSSDGLTDITTVGAVIRSVDATRRQLRFRASGNRKAGSGGVAFGWLDQNDFLMHRLSNNALRIDFLNYDTNPDTLTKGLELTNAGQLRVGSLGIGNHAPAATPGSVTGKIEVFDRDGNSLGFLPVYDAIT